MKTNQLSPLAVVFALVAMFAMLIPTQHANAQSSELGNVAFPDMTIERWFKYGSIVDRHELPGVTGIPDTFDQGNLAYRLLNSDSEQPTDVLGITLSRVGTAFDLSPSYLSSSEPPAAVGRILVRFALVELGSDDNSITDDFIIDESELVINVCESDSAAVNETSVSNSNSGIVECALPSFSATLDPNYNFVRGEAITPLELPTLVFSATDFPHTGNDNGFLTYSLVNPPAGLSFDTATNSLVGTPETSQVATPLTYQANLRTGLNAEPFETTFNVTIFEPSADPELDGVVFPDMTLERWFKYGSPVGRHYLPEVTGIPVGFDQGRLEYRLLNKSNEQLDEALGILFSPVGQQFGGSDLSSYLSSADNPAAVGRFLARFALVELGSDDNITTDDFIVAQSELTINVCESDSAAVNETSESNSNSGIVECALPSFSATLDPNYNFVRGEAITPLELPTLEFSGTGFPHDRNPNGRLTYSLVNPPTGLSFDPDTSSLVGTPTMLQAATPLTYQANLSPGLNAEPFETTFNVAVVEEYEYEFNAPIDGSSYTYQVGQDISLPLPLVQGVSGEAAWTYMLEYTNGGPVAMYGNRTIPGLSYTDTENFVEGFLSGIPTTAVAARTLIYTATPPTGVNSDSISGTFTVTIVEPPVYNFAENSLPNQYLLVGQDFNLTLPQVRDSTDEYVDGARASYRLDGGPSSVGLSFNTDSRVLSGEASVGNVTLNYVAIVDDEDVAMVEFNVMVEYGFNPPIDGPYTFEVDQMDITLLLPLVQGVSGEAAWMYILEYTNDGTPAMYSSDDGAETIPGLSFTDTGLSYMDTEYFGSLSGTPTVAAPALTLTYTATPPTGVNGGTPIIDTFTVTITDLDTVDTVMVANETVLPEIARDILASTAGAITTRIDRANAGSAGASFALGGQRNVLRALDSHGETMLESSSVARKKLLSGTEFTLGLGAAKDSPSQSAGGSVPVTFWGSGEYRDLAGDGDLDWSGAMYGFHLGVDTRLNNNVLLGLSVAQLESDIGYEDDAGDKGEQITDISIISPYVGWKMGALDLWAMVGSGNGELEILDAVAGVESTDLSMRNYGLGGSGKVWESDSTTLRVKGEATHSEMDVDGKGIIEALGIDATRIRASVEASRSSALAGQRRLESLLEVGVRHDGGDGETGGGLEVGGGWRYHAARVTAQARARVLLAHSADTQEWGIEGSIAIKAGADGQGLSLRIEPGYGDSASGTQELWQRGLPADRADSADGADYAARLQARVGYGMSLADRDGMLTPYGEMTLGEADSYRIGMNWKAGPRLDMNLLGERRNTDNTAVHAVLLKGSVHF